MSIQDYAKAQKLAEKEYRQAVSRGAYPYLPVLEELLRKNEVEGSVPLGQFEIPLALIAGTATAGRTSAFASNFMPLLDYDTEFGSKWSALCDSVQEMGVNEPIKVFEYMQRFYVVEGNKRVSVSKYNHAVAIEAVVTRILPKPAETDEYLIYSDFLEFYRVTKMYEIQMGQPRQFLRLLHAVTPITVPDDMDAKPAPPAPWDDDLRRDVKFLYSVFEAYYRSRNGQRLAITTGDAFLLFVEVYGFANLRGLSSAELHPRIERIWDEFRVLGGENPNSHILNPTAVSQKVSLVKKLPLTGTPVLHVAFLYPRTPLESGWSYNHELGRRYIEDSFGDAVVTHAYVATADEAEFTIEQAIADGCRMIFTTSPVYHAVTMRMAVAHPEIIMLNCAVNTAYKQMRTYYLRSYEAKFMTGVIAGSMTESGRIGYIADYPILGVPTSIAAFALGVKLVNPRALVHLDWSTLEHHDPYEGFREKAVDMISDKDICAPGDENDRFGLYGILGGASFRLAAPVWNWGSLYEDLVHSVLIGAWKNDSHENETSALNYYWGMSSGAIDVAYSDRIPSGTRKLVQLVQQDITNGSFAPFSGLTFAQDGSCKIAHGTTLTPDEIIGIDWLPDNVAGAIPDIDELAPQFRDFAKWHSIRRTTKLDMP